MKQQQASEQEKLQRLRENVEKQEARLKKVRALKGQVEQKRISNGKLGERLSLSCYGPFILNLHNTVDPHSLQIFILSSIYLFSPIDF